MRNIEAYSYGCVMATLPKPLADKVRGFSALISDEDLYDDGSGEYGREDMPHVTVAYLAHRKDDPNWYKKIFSNIFEGEEAEVDKLRFSTPDEKESWVKLTGPTSKVAARVAMSVNVACKFKTREGAVMNIGRELSRVAMDLTALSVGETFENDAFRAHRGMSSVRIVDLANAGKRGRKVETIAVYDLDYARKFKEWSQETSFGNLKKERTYAGAKSWAESLYEYLAVDNNIPVGFEKNTKRGVDVSPAGFKPIKIKTKYLTIDADYDRFSVQDNVDKNNIPTCIPKFDGGKRDIKVFYRWVQDNKSKIKRMTFSEVTEQMRKNGIKYHRYCAMD